MQQLCLSLMRTFIENVFVIVVTVVVVVIVVSVVSVVVFLIKDSRSDSCDL